MVTRSPLLRPGLLLPLILALLAHPGLGWLAPAATGTRGPSDPQTVMAQLAGAPLLVVENVGQFSPADGTADPGIRFQIRGAQGGTIWLTDDGLWLTIQEPAAPTAPPALADRTTASAMPASTPSRAIALRLRFEGAATPVLEPFGPLPTRLSYFKGSDPSRWRADVPVWSGVRYRGLYPDLDLVIDGTAGHFAWHWAPTSEQGLASLATARLRAEGADSLTFTDGRLTLATALGEQTLALPALTDSAAPGLTAVTPAVEGDRVVGPVGLVQRGSSNRVVR